MTSKRKLDSALSVYDDTLHCFRCKKTWNLWSFLQDFDGITGKERIDLLYGPITPEQIKQGTGHATNKAFERYFQREARDAVQVYQTMNDLQHTYN